MPEKRVTRKSVGVVTSETAHEKREERVVEEVHLVERTATYQSTEERGEQQPQGDDDSFQTTFSQEVSWTETRQGDFVEHYVQNGTIPGCDLAANSYLENCQKYGVQVDAGVVVALKTGSGSPCLIPSLLSHGSPSLTGPIDGISCTQQSCLVRALCFPSLGSLTKISTSAI